MQTEMTTSNTTPHLQTLERLLHSAMEPHANALPPEPQRDGLVQRLLQRYL